MKQSKNKGRKERGREERRGEETKGNERKRRKQLLCNVGKFPTLVVLGFLP